jgi:hypothetical protein
VTKQRRGSVAVRRPGVLAGIATSMAIVLSAGLVAAGSDAGEAAVWIDGPIDGGIVEPGLLTVTAHVTHPEGVDSVAVALDGEVVAEPEVDGATLEVVHVDVALDEGEHAIEVRGGRRDDLSRASVTVFAGDPRVDEPPDTPEESGADPPAPDEPDEPALPDEQAFPSLPGAPPPSPGVTQGPTAPPPTAPGPPPTTAPPCTPAVPVPSSPVGGADVTGPTVTFSWSYGGCTPIRFELRAGTDRSMASTILNRNAPGGARSLSGDLCPPNRTGTWFWQIRAVGTSPGPWSSTAVFNLHCRGA